MNKIFLGSILSALFLSTAFGQGLECFTGYQTNVARLSENTSYYHDFTFNGQLLATNLSCAFKGNAASCQNSNNNLDVVYSETYRLDRTTMTLVSSTTAVAFRLQSLNDSAVYHYDLTKGGANCLLL